MRAATVGYGNIECYALEALQAAPDLEITGVIRRAGTENEPGELVDYAVVKDIKELGGMEMAILCTPTRSVEKYAKGYLAMGINMVDSFDIHTGIVDLRRTLDATARKHKTVSITPTGWDPGSGSIIRTMFKVVAPKGIAYTSFDPGMSMGHAVAVKTIDGAEATLFVTIPTGTGIHHCMVYIELKGEYKLEEVIAIVEAGPCFMNNETHAKLTPSVDTPFDMGHGINLARKGVSDKTRNQLFELNIHINNPALTTQVLMCVARASVKQQPGCYAIVEVPVIDPLLDNHEK